MGRVGCGVGCGGGMGRVGCGVVRGAGYGMGRRVRWRLRCEAGCRARCGVGHGAGSIDSSAREDCHCTCRMASYAACSHRRPTAV